MEYKVPTYKWDLNFPLPMSLLVHPAGIVGLWLCFLLTYR